VKPPPFDYHVAGSVEEAVSLLAQREDALLLAGGQSLIPLLNMRLAQPEALVDVNRVPGLDGIGDENGCVRLGALVRYRTLERSPVVGSRLPLLAEAVRFVGDPQVRTRGTVGGALAQADPTGEIAVASLALGATVTAQSSSGVRSIALDSFFEGLYATALEHGEMITEIEYPYVPTAVSAFGEHARRHGDFAVVGVAAVGVPAADASWQSVRIALGGAADRPLLAEEASELLAGTSLEPETIAAAAAGCAAVARPRSDVRASADYRRHLISIYVQRVLEELRARRSGGGD
jgi:carbon-monoxide dehydrogenase medium subunit